MYSLWVEDIVNQANLSHRMGVLSQIQQTTD